MTPTTTTPAPLAPARRTTNPVVLVFRPRRRAPALTGKGWVVAMLIAAAALGATAAAVRAEEPERYSPSSRSGREAVRELAEIHFAPDQVGWAMATARCESGYDLYAYSGGFDRRLGVWYEFWGALQVDAVTWGKKAWELFGGPLSDPAVNFPMAAWIAEHLGRGHWPVCGR